MTSPNYTSALIVGAGQGLSASLTRLFRKEGLAVAIAARDTAKLAPLCAETGARAFGCDAQDEAQVQRLFADLEREQGCAGRGHLQRQRAHARALRRTRARRGPARIAGHRVRSISGRAAGRRAGCCQRDTARFCSPVLRRA